MRIQPVDISGWNQEQLEQSGGTRDLVWLTEPSPDEKNRAWWLFKPNKPERSADEANSELAAHLIAQRLGVPSAEIQLAFREGQLGCISRSIVPNPRLGLTDGAVFIGALTENFNPRAKRAEGHTAANIAAVMIDLDPPAGSPEGMGATGVFAGFLILDALIGNTDRHSRNWSVETRLTGRDRLAASYDHATSLGVTTRDSKRDKLLEDPASVQRFVRRGMAKKFEDGQKMSLVEYAVAFTQMYAEESAPYWRGAINNVVPRELDEIVASVQMSEDAAKLASSIVRTNRERILACLD